MVLREITPESNKWGDGTPFRRGDDAWPVVALQANLNLFGNRLVLDGAFGPATEKITKLFQQHRGLTSDGIAGPVTQETLCRDLGSVEALKRNLPDGLIRGMIENESSYMLAAFTPHPDGSGFDLGPLQEAFYGPATQLEYLQALNVRGQAAAVSTKLRAQHDRYIAEGASDRLAWECAALYHNRPVSADRLAVGKTAAVETGPVRWVEAASGGALHTIAEWCAAYIAKATKYVNWDG